jgi:RNA polymerase sigma-70 factor (ECF subfamily)
MLRACALRLARNDADADDLVQETFARALAHQDSLSDHEKVASWMVMILHNVFMDECRRRQTHRQAQARYEHEREMHTAADAEPPPSWAAVTPEQMTAAIARLSNKLRECYVRKVNGRSYQEIAEELGIPLNTVATRIRRARDMLKEILSRQVEP